MNNAALETTAKYPEFLKEYGMLLSHMQTQFETLDSRRRGITFEAFVQRLIPHTPIGERFERPEKTTDTHDKGIDFKCSSEDGSGSLYVQSKYTMAGVDELDLVISKFEAFEKEHQSPQQASLFDPKQQADSPVDHYMIVTAQDLSSKIIPKYEESRRATVKFYKQLKSEKRIHIVDGPKVFQLLRETYRKSYQLPSNLTLNFEKPYIHMGDVYVAILAGSELMRLYTEFGNAIFFENIREYKGPTSGRVKAGPGQNYSAQIN